MYTCSCWGKMAAMYSFETDCLGICAKHLYNGTERSFFPSRPVRGNREAVLVMRSQFAQDTCTNVCFAVGV